MAFPVSNAALENFDNVSTATEVHSGDHRDLSMYQIQHAEKTSLACVRKAEKGFRTILVGEAQLNRVRRKKRERVLTASDFELGL